MHFVGSYYIGISLCRLKECKIYRNINKNAIILATFYIHGSVHRDSISIRSNEMQQYVCVYLPQNYSTLFGCLSHPSPGVHQTVTAASGTGHSVRATTFRQRGL